MQNISEPVIEIAAVGKTYRTHQGNFEVLSNISLTINKGDVLGLIGPNGAGKSTLLKIMSGIVRPSSGKIIMKGRVGSVLDIGTGFHPDLTGRENIFISGNLTGHSQSEVNEVYNEIVAFSEIGELINEPVKYYSSGMYLRLAFSVIVHLKTDILLLDEVLSVGDAAFRNKCHEKMKDFARAGKTMVLAGHNIDELQSICTQLVWLEKGQIKKHDVASETGQAYLLDAIEQQFQDSETVTVSHSVIEVKEEAEVSFSKPTEEIATEEPMVQKNEPAAIPVNAIKKDFKLTASRNDWSHLNHLQNVADRFIPLQAQIKNEHGDVADELFTNQPFKVELEFKTTDLIESAQIIFNVRTMERHMLIATSYIFAENYVQPKMEPGIYRACFSLDGNLFNAGQYIIGFFVATDERNELCEMYPALLLRIVHLPQNSMKIWSAQPPSIQYLKAGYVEKI